MCDTLLTSSDIIIITHEEQICTGGLIDIFLFVKASDEASAKINNS